MEQIIKFNICKQFIIEQKIINNDIINIIFNYCHQDLLNYQQFAIMLTNQLIENPSKDLQLVTNLNPFYGKQEEYIFRENCYFLFPTIVDKDQLIIDTINFCYQYFGLSIYHFLERVENKGVNISDILKRVDHGPAYNIGFQEVIFDEYIDYLYNIYNLEFDSNLKNFEKLKYGTIFCTYNTYYKKFKIFKYALNFLLIPYRPLLMTVWELRSKDRPLPIMKLLNPNLSLSNINSILQNPKYKSENYINEKIYQDYPPVKLALLNQIIERCLKFGLYADVNQHDPFSNQSFLFLMLGNSDVIEKATFFEFDILFEIILNQNLIDWNLQKKKKINMIYRLVVLFNYPLYIPMVKQLIDAAPDFIFKKLTPKHFNYRDGENHVWDLIQIHRKNII